MNFELPDFKTSYCQIFTVCGPVLSEKPSLGKGWFGKQPMIARYRSKKGSALFRLGAPREQQQYIHVDCALSAFFPKGRVPKPTHKKEDIFRVLAKAIGAELNAGVTARFLFPYAKLPKSNLIRAISQKYARGGISLRLVAGTFELQGMPIRRIDWEIIKEQKLVCVDLVGEGKMVLHSGYLTESFELVNSFFTAFVVGGSRDGTK